MNIVFKTSRRELLTLYENVASELDKQMDIVGVLADAIDAYESSVNSTDPAESIFPPAKELYSSPNYGVQNGSYFDDTDSVNNEETDSFSESGYNYDQEGYYNWSDSEYYNQDSMNAKVPENINTKNATILIPMNNSNNQVKKWTYDIFSQNKQLKNKSINLISNFKQIPEFSRYQTAKANEKSHENYLGNLLNTPTQTSSIEKTSESSRQAKPFEYDLNYYSPEDKTDTAGDTNSTNREAYLSYNDGEYIDEAYNNQENNNYIDNQWFEVAGSNQTMDGFMNTKESDQYEGKYNIPSPTEYPIEQETTYNTDEFTTYEDPSLFSEKTFDNYINFNDSSTETNGGHYDKFNSNLTDLSNSFIDSLLKKTANSTLIDLNNYGNADLPDFNSLDEFFLNQNENDLSNQPENKNSENPDKTPDKTPSFPEEADISTVDIQANGLSPMDMDNMYPDLYEEMLSEISSTDEEEKANKYLSVLEEVDQEVNDGNTKDLSSKDNYYYPDPQNLENKQETLINNMINEEIQNKKYEIQMKKNAEENRLTTLQLALIISAGSMPVLLIIVLLLYTLLCRLKKTKTPYKVMENDDVYDKKIMPAEGGNENYSVSV